MTIKSEIAEFTYDGVVKQTLTIENYPSRANMVTLTIGDEQINVRAEQLLEAVKRCNLGFI